MSFTNCFNIACLESSSLQMLFHETTSYRQGIAIEVVASRRTQRNLEEHPATTVGLTLQSPVIQIADWLDKGRRIEALAHELAHLLSVYRYGLGVIGQRIPRHGDSGEVFRFFMSMRGDWV